MKVSSVIVAAGKGTRMGAEKNKVFLNLIGKTILEHTVAVFQNAEIIDEVIVVTNDKEECQELLSGYDKVTNIVDGGATRQESVKKGLMCAKGDYVAIHDGARALIKEDEIVASVKAAEKFGAAAVGVKSKDTLKKIDKNGFIIKTVDREFVYNIQTPQVFKLDEIKKMHTLAADGSFTDDCALAESFGVRIKMVDGSYDNIKITTPDDLEIAEKILKNRSMI
ncbi:MAG: 2-C-methyl-D-erythritol 4-phosphate cytidylyltransferase [Ruminococcaceae bacterium]|nr:2-C-methyl-D-erythritol 4-phosphate cytidylyltransferase [Oscillospiraceae bacterium]